jgi:hypothetical protein
MRTRSWPFLVGTSSWRAINLALLPLRLDIALALLARELGIVAFHGVPQKKNVA